MQSKIEGVPEGWELVRIGKPSKGETAIVLDGSTFTWPADCDSNYYAIVRKIEPPDPGEGWRWVSENEWLENGDEVHSHGKWCSIGITRCKIAGEFYRRRLPRYRPFANAKEFEPHRDRWLMTKDGLNFLKVFSYSDDDTYQQSKSFKEMFDEFLFDDGTPCGVLVE